MSDRPRPFVICHMIMSIDGKILSRRWKNLPESKLTGKLYESTAAEFGIGSWLVGTTTMKELTGQEKSPSAGKGVKAAKLEKIAKSKSSVPKGDFIAQAEAETFAIGTDTRGVLRFSEDNIGGDHAVVLTTELAKSAYLAHLRQMNVSYLICGKKQINFKSALKKLQTKFKIERLLLEGGGGINGAMMQAGLIDEISQLIVPIVDGGGAAVTGFFESTGKAPTKALAGLTLIKQKTLAGGSQWLHFAVN